MCRSDIQLHCRGLKLKSSECLLVHLTMNQLPVINKSEDGNVKVVV